MGVPGKTHHWPYSRWSSVSFDAVVRLSNVAIDAPNAISLSRDRDRNLLATQDHFWINGHQMAQVDDLAEFTWHPIGRLIVDLHLYDLHPRPISDFHTFRHARGTFGHLANPFAWKQVELSDVDSPISTEVLAFFRDTFVRAHARHPTLVSLVGWSVRFCENRVKLIQITREVVANPWQTPSAAFGSLRILTGPPGSENRAAGE
jgi:hypothetical protein